MRISDTITKSLLIMTIMMASALFVGCGSDDSTAGLPSDDVASPETPMVTGQFLDDLVQGLDYACSSGNTGTTDANGTFTCASGDEVRFMIGETVIGSADADQGIITPYTLFPDDEDAAIALARLLQSTDSDGQSENGVIVIDTQTAESLPADLDFSDAGFETIVEDVLGVELISVDQAQAHLDDELVKAGVEIPFDPDRPVADGGSDQTVMTGSTVDLDGSESHGVQGSPLTFLWTIVDLPTGSNASFSDRRTRTPSFIADLEGIYVIELVVTEAEVRSLTERITITVQDEQTPPVAEAGEDQLHAPGAIVTLDGTQSSDQDQDTLMYAWHFVSQPEGSSATFDDANASTPSFTADVEGQYLIELLVEDEEGNSSTDQVVVTVVQGIARHLDASFAGDGIAVEEIPADTSSIVLGSDGSVFQAGNIYIWKYKRDGVLDSIFGGDGITTVPVSIGDHNSSEIKAIVLDAQGRVYVAGHSQNRNGDTDMTLWKFGSDGRLDQTFGDAGVVFAHDAAGGQGYDFASAIALDSNGRVYVAGHSENAQGDYDMVLWRYGSDGTLDTTFGREGLFVFDSKQDLSASRRVTSLRDIARPYVDAHDISKDLVFDTTGKVYLLGVSYDATDMVFDTILVKVQQDGSLDTSFADEGVMVYDSSVEGPCGSEDDYAEAMVLNGLDEVFVAGTREGSCRSVSLSLVKFSRSGHFVKRADPPSFDLQMFSSTYKSGADAIARDHSGNVFISGYINRDYVDWGRMYVAKYTDDLMAETTFADGGVVVYANPYGSTGDGLTCRAIAVDIHGSVYISGSGPYGPVGVSGESATKTLTIKYR